MESFATLVGTGWAAGINLYLVTFLLGLAGRLGWGDVPGVLTRTDVMAVTGVLYLVEFVADKVPYLDNVWDAIHTVVRPLGAAALGAVIAGESESIGAAVGAVVAGALALDAHAAKASTRVVTNTSPEPFSNVALSLVEDLGVAGVVLLALTYPVAAIVVVAILAVAAATLTVWLWRMVRRNWRKVPAGMRGRRSAP